MKIEIGGNIPVTEDELLYTHNDSCIYNCEIFNSYIYTHSGRSAINLLLQLKLLKNNTIFLPDYTCDTCIKPFFNKNFDIIFYKINSDLSINLDDIKDKLKNNSNSTVYIQSYFGFNTLKEQITELNKLKDDLKLTYIYDFTHSWLTSPDFINADFYIASFRKWLSAPDGGILASKNIDLKKYNISIYENDTISKDYIHASKLKIRYLQDDITVKKNDFYPLFKKTAEYFNTTEIYSITKFSKSIYQNSDFKKISLRRHENGLYLMNNIQNPCIKHVFNSFEKETIPLYIPIYIKDGYRDVFQKYLINHNIYFPIHWPVPDLLQNNPPNIYNNIISIVCDHRYTLDDIKYIISIINSFNPNEA